MKIDSRKNTIVCGDNLEWLKELADESVDLCYIDPPFFSNRNYEVIWGNGYEIRSFGDRFSGGVSHYIEWMRPRVELIHAKIKKSGAIFLHCDWHASHRLRCLLDDIFGEQNFRSEIIWQRTQGSKGDGRNPRGLSNNTDTIFYYSKTDDFKFKGIYLPYSDEQIKKQYKYKDAKGYYSSENMRNPGYRPNLIYTYKGYKPHPNGWTVTKEKMEELDRQGLLIFPKNQDGRIRKKNYIKDMLGVRVSNLWDDINAIQGAQAERLGYPTQKPEALLKRIIECATDEGDLVLDAFAGGGTSAKVAADLKRRFIVGDVSPVAIRIMAERLNFDCPNMDYEIKNLPSTVDGFKKIEGHKFAETVCDLMGWKVNERKSGDGGIDAWDGRNNPVQIKNHAKTAAGRPDMQRFFGALAKEKKKRGTFVAWSFSKDAREFIAEMKREHGVEIQAMPCEEIFKDLLIDEKKQLELNLLYEERYPKDWKSRPATSEEHMRSIEKARAGLKKERKSPAKEA